MRPVGAQMLHVEWCTDGHEANSHFFQFCERAYKSQFFPPVQNIRIFSYEPEVPVVLNRFIANTKVMSESRPTANVRQIYCYQHLLLDKSTSLVVW
jgi:hypothetical protein